MDTFAIMGLEWEGMTGWLLYVFAALGVVMLWFGGEGLTKGASGLALLLRISPVVVGLTVVSIATSMPELVTSFVGASQGKDGLVIGNIVGSNLANMGLILGVTALIFPITVQIQLIRREVPVLVGVSIIFAGLCTGGGLTRLEGFGLLLGVLGYLMYVLKGARMVSSDEQQEFAEEVAPGFSGVVRCILWVIFGGVALWAGAEVLVGSAVEIATRWGVDAFIIGITVVAVGTSLPELAASISAAAHKHSDICAGNIVGSNIFNMLLIGGGVSCVYPLSVSEGLLVLEFPAMLLLTLLMWRVFMTNRKVARWEGVLLLGVYAAVMYFVVI